MAVARRRVPAFCAPLPACRPGQQWFANINASTPDLMRNSLAPGEFIGVLPGATVRQCVCVGLPASFLLSFLHVGQVASSCQYPPAPRIRAVRRATSISREATMQSYFDSGEQASTNSQDVLGQILAGVTSMRSEVGTSASLPEHILILYRCSDLSTARANGPNGGRRLGKLAVSWPADPPYEHSHQFPRRAASLEQQF